MSERKKLTLIDGHGLAYRQFHGLPMDKFTTMSGEPTNATWGFARALLDIMQSPNPPDYLAVAFDQGLSGRETVYTEYKANREEMADSLSVQIARIRELVQTFNIPILEKEGYEADDVIGSVVQQAVASGADVRIVTGDRDLMQLVEDHVTLELPTPPAQARQAGPSQFYDLARVIERWRAARSVCRLQRLRRGSIRQHSRRARNRGEDGNSVAPEIRYDGRHLRASGRDQGQPT